MISGFKFGNHIPHIRPRGEEKKQLERNPDFHARRWAVEVTHSFSIDSANSWSVMKRKLPTIWHYFNLPVLSLSGVSSFAFIVNFEIGSMMKKLTAW